MGTAPSTGMAFKALGHAGQLGRAQRQQDGPTWEPCPATCPIVRHRTSYRPQHRPPGQGPSRNRALLLFSLMVRWKRGQGPSLPRKSLLRIWDFEYAGAEQTQYIRDDPALREALLQTRRSARHHQEGQGLRPPRDPSAYQVWRPRTARTVSGAGLSRHVHERLSPQGHSGRCRHKAPSWLVSQRQQDKALANVKESLPRTPPRCRQSPRSTP